MTETTSEQPRETTAAAESPDRRWDKSHRRGRPFRLAAFVVTLAGIVFIIAVIFWSGFILGACESGEAGGHHHRHGEGGSGQQERGDSMRDNGMTPYGVVVIEQTMPSAGLAA